MSTWFGDDIEAAIPELRAHAEARMVDEVLVEAKTGKTRYNPETGQDEETFEEMYRGRCRWKQNGGTGESQGVVVEGSTITLLPLELHLPVEASAGVREGMRATALTGVHDPALVGRQVWIRREHAASQTTARRLGVSEV
ncbi:DUF6093 family protein [Luteipulveratus halotolerans]|uniref:DUF6093 family protein n=1 Tax=Luteipulveratus halotolerans TaxID=1631356 RepID=UPI0012FBACA4|nr:DUF6093 family protein [Luteipulveratus halotolerans]